MAFNPGSQNLNIDKHPRLSNRLLCKSSQQARHIAQFLRQPRNDLPSAIKQITQGITLTVNPLTLSITPIIRL